MDRDVVLKHWEARLDCLEKQYKRVSSTLQTEPNPQTQVQLEQSLENIKQEMRECEEEIDVHKRSNRYHSLKKELNDLIFILKSEEDQLQVIFGAYKQTIIHWPVREDANANTVEAILNELEKIAVGQSSYSAQSEFIAHLVKKTSSPALANALNQWGQQYRDGIDWLKLHDESQSAQNKKLENAQPAIFMKITRHDEASTQSAEGELYYQLNAWLIEDLDIYQQRKAGYHALVSTDSLEAQPCSLEDLLQKMPELLNHFLAERTRLCESCENFPQIHVFLPLELMHLGVEAWQLNPPSGRRLAKCIGHEHVVVLRCAHRYERTYTKVPGWRKLWKRHQSVLAKRASDVFVSGHDEDLDELVDILEEAVQPESNIVGLHLTQPPVDIEEFCYELLESGLPLAVWRRQDLQASAQGADWPVLLTKCCLEKLPQTVQQERSSAKRKSEDSHLGHHLSLLWDDPNLVPPKSA
jgi:vWA-MoxR associated protein C-terminal domain/vWA-MoxR associated protein middle region (VMAP-M) 1/Effector-associated domain 9